MIRRATINDVTEVMGMAKNFYIEAGYKEKYGLPMDTDSVIEFVVSFISDQDKVCLLSEGKGFIAGALIPWFFNKKKTVAQEMAWWVLPEKRQGMVAGKLFKAFETWSKNNSADMLMMGSIPSLDGGRINRFYERKNMMPAESLYGRAM